MNTRSREGDDRISTAALAAAAEAGRASGRIAVFAGTTPNIGTTITAFGTAVKLAGRTMDSVGYVCLNFKSSKLHRYLGEDQPPFALDSFRAELRSRTLDGRRLLQFGERFKGLPNFHTLYGSVLREQAEFYQPEDVRQLLQAVREAFDVCVVDVSAYWDNAATVSAMLEADERVVVTTPDLGHFQEDMTRGLKTIAPMLGLVPESFVLVLNQTGGCGRMEGGLRVSDIRKETNMPIAAEIRRYPELLEILNQGRLLEFVQGNASFHTQLEPIVSRLLKAFTLTPCPPPAEGKAWIRKRQPWLSGS